MQVFFTQVRMRRLYNSNHHPAVYIHAVKPLKVDSSPTTFW